MSDDIYKEAKEWLEESFELRGAARQMQDDDWKFAVDEKQWPDNVRRAREGDPENPRPCLTVNETMHHARQVINEMRVNRPEARVLPVDNKADKRTAEMMMGLIRHISQVSDADIAYDAAAERMVISGEGYWELGTEIIDFETNQREICIYPIFDPGTVDMDVRDDPFGSDAPRCLISYMMPKHMFRKKYPDVKLPSSWIEGQRSGWFDKRNIRVGRYWQVSSAREMMSMIESPEGDRLILPSEQYEDEKEGEYFGWEWCRDHAMETKKVRCYVLAGKEVVEEIDWPGRYIPVVRTIGEEYIVDGKRLTYGMVRRAKDAQRIKNYTFSAYVEQVALSPKAPFTGPARAFQGHERRWQLANRVGYAFLPYNDVDEQGQPISPPTRQPAPEIAAGWAQGMQMANEALAQTTGKFDPSTGDSVQDMSGKALSGWQMRGDIGSYHYLDNMAKAIRHTARIIVDLAPKVYDTARIARILGEDGEPDTVNLFPGMGEAYAEEPKPDGGYEKFYDLSVGRYDVRAAAGPSYTTRRQEAAERMERYVSENPQLWNVIGDIVMRISDSPMADELADRMSRAIPPEIMGEDSEQNLRQQLAQSMQKLQQQEQLIGELLKRADDTDIERVKAGSDVMDSESKRMDSETKLMEAIAKLEQSERNRAEEIRQAAEEAAASVLASMQG